VIVASHRDLFSLVEGGKFREDLYYRLNVLSVDLPPLSERAEDRQTMPLPGRIAKRLLSLAEEHGKRPIVGGPVEVRLPQQDLADLVGTTRESVNKQLRSWAEAGLIEIGRGRVVLKKPAELEDVVAASEL